jgi:hypothetical protein
MSLVDKAVALFRRGSNYLEVLDTLEADLNDTLAVRAAISEAQTTIEKQDKTALECAVLAFEQGETFFGVAKKLQACGFQSFDADQMTRRALVAFREKQQEAS